MIDNIGKCFRTKRFRGIIWCTTNTRSSNTSNDKSKTTILFGDPQKESGAIGNVIHNSLLLGTAFQEGQELARFSCTLLEYQCCQFLMIMVQKSETVPLMHQQCERLVAPFGYGYLFGPLEPYHCMLILTYRMSTLETYLFSANKSWS